MQERERHISKKKFICKRNKGDHILVWIPPNKLKSDYIHDEKNQYLANLMQYRPETDNQYGGGANIYICSKCGHIEWKWLDKNGNEK
jgi:hypothetical protein